jgi:hypothetical protein
VLGPTATIHPPNPNPNPSTNPSPSPNPSPTLTLTRNTHSHDPIKGLTEAWAACHDQDQQEQHQHQHKRARTGGTGDAGDVGAAGGVVSGRAVSSIPALWMYRAIAGVHGARFCNRPYVARGCCWISRLLLG